MGKLLTRKQIKEIIKEVKTFDNKQAHDFSDIDFNKIGKALQSGTSKKYLPPSTVDGLIEVKYPEYPNNSATTAFGIIPLGGLWRYIERVIRWVFKQKNSLIIQIRDILRKADEIYFEHRQKINEISKEYNDDPIFNYILFLPDLFYFLIKVLADKEVDKKIKAEIVFGIVYYVSPIDLIPELFIPHPVAYADDAVVLITIFEHLIDGKHVSRSKLVEYWPGEVKLLDSIGEWIDVIENLLGKKFIKELFKYMKEKTSVKEKST